MTVIALTGAHGRLGSRLRGPLADCAEALVCCDLVDDIGPLHPKERYQKADVAELDQMLDLLQGVDTVVHFAAIVDEAPFEKLLGPNFIGAYNVWEAAYRCGVKRVVYASSIHAVGMYPRTQYIDADVPHRPDTFYGLAKCFAEDLARMYHDKRGIEAVCLRILSCAAVNNERALGTWLSYDDLVQLVLRSVETPVVGFTIVYGVSANDRAPVDNAKASFLGYRPKDNAEEFAEDILPTAPPVDPQDPARHCQGGPFASVPLGEGIVGQMNIVDEDQQSQG